MVATFLWLPIISSSTQATALLRLLVLFHQRRLQASVFTRISCNYLLMVRIHTVAQLQ